jgi:non-ribosomal peptide synthetase component F
MNNPTCIVELPAKQRAIRDKCFHPSGNFVEFLKEEVEQSIPERFEKIVRRYPHRLAIKAKDASFTYEELNNHAKRIAHSILAAVGAGNRPVAILMKHGASVVAAILGALKAGKIYVPLDTTYPQERLRFMLQDAQAELILVQPETGALAASISEGKLLAIDVEHLSACIANDDVGLHVPPSAFAYILYTSGSTGQPKGVVDNHRNVLHGTLRFTNPQHIGAEDRISLTHSCSSSASVRRIFPALLNGAALFPLDIKEGGLHSLARFLNEESITIFGSGRIRDVVRSFDRTQTFPSLRLVSFGGEVVHRKDLDLYRKIFGPHCVFGIWMSSTEAGNITQFLIDGENQFAGDIVPAGYPAADVEVMALDETAQSWNQAK